MKTFEDVKHDALEYIGLYDAPESDVAAVLSAVVGKYGKDVFLDAGTLHKGMADAGATELECFRICLMTQVSGFQKLLEQDRRTAQLDLDRYVQNAAEETGFNRDTILRLTGGIVSAIEGEMSRESGSSDDAEIIPRASELLATSLYDRALRNFQAGLDMIGSGEQKVNLDFTTIETLSNLGIPRARYCLGYCLLNGIQVPSNEERGLELLQDAADMGDSKAAAALGDYCYQRGGSSNWTKAYQYYTGFGAVALNESRRSAVTNILNQRHFNRKLLKLCAVLAAVCFLTVILAPASSLFGPHRIWGCLAVVAQLMLLGLGWIHYRASPYDFFYWLPVAMSGSWFVYLVIRLLF